MPTLAAVSIPVCTRLPRFARARRHSEQPWLSRRPPLPRAGLRSGTSRRGACGSPWRAPSGSCKARGPGFHFFFFCLLLGFAWRGSLGVRALEYRHHLPAILNFVFCQSPLSQFSARPSPRTPLDQCWLLLILFFVSAAPRQCCRQLWLEGVRGQCTKTNMKLSIAG